MVSMHVYPPHPRAMAHPERCPFGMSEGCAANGTLSLELAEAAAASAGKLLFVGEFGGPPPNFTGPGAAEQAYPEAVLRLQSEPTAAQHGGGARAFALSAIWAWACPSHLDEMRCLYTREGAGTGPSSSHTEAAAYAGSERLLERLQHANARMQHRSSTAAHPRMRERVRLR
eukprot:6798647-Prymnesium_polylepis.1